MPWPWKRKPAAPATPTPPAPSREDRLLGAIVDLKNGVHSGFSMLAKKIDEIPPGYPDEAPGETGQPTDEAQNNLDSPGKEQFIPFTSRNTTIYDEPIRAIEAEIAACRDANKIKELSKTLATINGYRTRKIASLKSGGHRVPRLPEYRTPDAVMDAEGQVVQGEIPEEVYDRAAEQVGVSKDGKIDAKKILNAFQSASKHPVWGKVMRNVASQYGVTDLDGTLSAFGEAMKDPEQMAAFGTAVGAGVVGVLKEKVAPWVKEHSQPPQQPQQPGNGGVQGEIAGHTNNIPPRPFTLVNGVPLDKATGQRVFQTPYGLINPAFPYPVTPQPGQAGGQTI